MNSKLALGTVQLGQNYGIANKLGKPRLDQAYEILKTAQDNGIYTIDTAPGYGDSEWIIGSFLKQTADQQASLKIVTKIPKLPESLSDREVYEFIENSLTQSKQALGTDTIEACLLHSADDLRAYNGKVIEALHKIRGLGIIHKIGASIYSPKDVKEFLSIGSLDIIQIPFNLFDLRLVSNGYLEKLFSSNVEIHARSIYLQGLFFMELKELPTYLSEAKEYLKKLEELALELGMSKSELAYVYVRDTLEISKLVVGCETASQLNENIRISKLPPLNPSVRKEISEIFLNVPEKIINPALWGK